MLDGSVITWGEGLLGTPVGNYLVLNEVGRHTCCGWNLAGVRDHTPRGRWAAAAGTHHPLLPEYRCNKTICFRFLLH